MSNYRAEKISGVELCSVMILFTTASVMILPVGALAGHFAWISIIIATVMGLGYAWVYTYLYNSHPGKSMIEISEILLGCWGGKLIGILYFLFSIQLATFLMNEHWKFTMTVALPNTPLLVIAATMLALVLWITYAGIETIGRISIVIVPVLIFSTMMAFILLSKDFNFNYLLPVFGDKWAEVLYSALQISTLPFGEGVLFMFIYPHLQKKSGAKVPTLLGITIAGIIIFVVNITNTLVLGELRSRIIYPTYASFSYIQIADFLNRAEITIFTIFITINFIKMAVCVYVAAVSLAELFRLINYRILLIPLGFLMVEWSIFILRSQAELIGFITYTWPLYIIPLQFFIPLGLLILSLLKKKEQHQA